MKPLTPQQQKILDFIRQAVEASGFPPTRAEIARALNFRSPNAAEAHLRALEKKGAIEILRGAARGLKLTESPGMPVIGRVAAGAPMLAESNVQRRCPLDPDLFQPRADYLLEVRGLSMLNAGILEGDLVAVHSTPQAKEGQIVVARVHDEVTVKRLHRRGALVELVAENPQFAPIVVDPQRDLLTIEGIVVGVLRTGTSL
jgi:repressor LexA